ncbi:hypothetical protein CHS0354_028877 [Potamilus streckersoni]|uniref:Uncharacterized protein n=1 Tax=Potamilus streckersoni TaxID=2493646 RepID=A0AAE0RQM5_9BIVA|nr:hypothetical protein CHS0354_028877 [Potamilus streckersoni]
MGERIPGWTNPELHSGKGIPETKRRGLLLLDEIRKTSLSAVLCANIGLTQIQRDAFRLPEAKLVHKFNYPLA